ncbi:hypothetical protein DTO027B5_2230 [Paecilomyces variotii]|nr:hypothetical protein DTO169C6_6944 [Paecilomyces variotii]KAJ9287705.1 hypothetical protein DTO021C3_4763 [Paecilomyces variotii]KAJ9328614.1 hypothetical protein DTO027B3_880 [Paecilomyces variotii]KAJ9335915.1 hypothetical protein DTO027B5_2230 [Paecilomyces variotii]KAJ9364426.1 hypothetical protein DTO280E4_1672 [Paecilomyces variotii]
MKLRSLILPDPIIPEDLDYNHIWQCIVSARVCTLEVQMGTGCYENPVASYVDRRTRIRNLNPAHICYLPCSLKVSR